VTRTASRIRLKPFRRFDGRTFNFEAARRKNFIRGLLLIDVTEVRRSGAGWQQHPLRRWSCMPWPRAVDEDRIMHAYGRRNQLILFDDVDINIQIEVVAEQHMGRRGCVESAESAWDRAAIRPDDVQNSGRAGEI
jgi:hypothetical protein